MVSILLLAIFMIGAASAADVNVTDTASDVLAVESVDEDVIAGSPGTFAELQSLVDNTASGKTLYLEKDYSTDKSGSTVKISNSITIDGKGHTVNANEKSNIFLVDNKNVVLKNINFINSYEMDSAVHSNYKDCKVINCSFKNCVGYEGGAIHMADAYDCTFENCGSDMGGAIWQGNAYGCSFVKCYSPVDSGGAIFEGNAYDCSFVDCYALAGGAICYGNAYGCSFVGCSANEDGSVDWCDGGAIYKGNAYNSSFVDCLAYRGGAICYGDAHNCSFVDSTSMMYGGAIFKGNAFDSYFKNCAGSDNGGAIYQGNATNCCFENCYAMSGGAICSGNAFNCSFIKCHDGYEFGGAISGGDAHNCSFVGCSGLLGGAIGGGDAYNCLFINCSASQGGAIEEGSAFDCLFINCSASEGGAINYGNASNCLFINCSAEEHGAVIYDGTASDSFCVNCHDGYDDELSYPTAWSEDNYNEGNYALKSDSPFIYGYVAANSIDSGHVIVVAKMASGATGNVKFTIDGVTKKVKIANGKAQTFYDLAGGIYPVDIKYDGNNIYPADSISTSIEIEQQNAISSVSADDVEYGQDAIIKIKVNKDAEGNLDVTVNNITQNVIITGSTLNVSFTGLKIGSYDVAVSYPGSDKFPAQNMTSSFSVVKGTPIASVNVSDPVGFGDDAIITVEMNGVNGNVWFTVSDENKTKILTNKSHIENGVATISIPGLGLGKYYLHLYYAGTTRYNAQTIKKTFEVVKKTPIASVDVYNCVPGEDALISVKVNGANGNIWFTISDENRTKILTDKIHIENGWANTTISGLGLGKYYLHTYYAGTNHYRAQTIKANFEVAKISPALSVAKTTVDGKTVLTASIAEDARGNIKFEVNGNVYKVLIVKGTATLTLPDMEPGTYTLKTSYAGNYKYLPETKTRSITIR